MELDSRKCGYRFNKDVFEFYCYKDEYKDLVDSESVYVTGTFNGWLNSGDSDWLMTRKNEKGKIVYILEKNLEKILVPGNSGFPEFKFFALSENSFHVLQEKTNAPNIFLGNKLILLSKSDFEEADKLRKKSGIFKELESFDLNCPACRAEIANFRRVPGTRALFRGYHPYKKSRGWMDTENERINLVRKGLELYGIKSDITLCGYEAISTLAEETESPEIQEMEQKNNRLCVNIDYNLVYFHPDAAEYLNALQKIAKFMISHPGPFYIHCRLGSDRTGVTCAIFSALCGASWKEIAEDYEKTNDCGIGEYRNRKLLQYSLKKITGYDPSGSKNLAKLMQSVFIKENILKASEIENLIKKLNTEPRKKETDFFDFTGNHICGRKSANI